MALKNKHLETEMQVAHPFRSGQNSGETEYCECCDVQSKALVSCAAFEYIKRRRILLCLPVCLFVRIYVCTTLCTSSHLIFFDFSDTFTES